MATFTKLEREFVIEGEPMKLTNNIMYFPVTKIVVFGEMLNRWYSDKPDDKNGLHPDCPHSLEEIIEDTHFCDLNDQNSAIMAVVNLFGIGHSTGVQAVQNEIRSALGFTVNG